MIAKEILDKVLSFVALVFLLPIFLIVSIAIKLDSPGPVFLFRSAWGKMGKFSGQ